MSLWRIFVLYLCCFLGMERWIENAPRMALAAQAQAENKEKSVLSYEDQEIIEQLSLLENLDYWEEDIDFLQTYNSIDTISQVVDQDKENEHE